MVRVPRRVVIGAWRRQVCGRLPPVHIAHLAVEDNLLVECGHIRRCWGRCRQTQSSAQLLLSLRHADSPFAQRQVILFRVVTPSACRILQSVHHRLNCKTCRRVASHCCQGWIRLSRKVKDLVESHHAVAVVVSTHTARIFRPLYSLLIYDLASSLKLGQIGGGFVRLSLPIPVLRAFVFITNR